MKTNIRRVLSVYWQEVKRRLPLAFLLLFALTVARVTDLFVPVVYKQFFDILGSGQPADDAVHILISVIVTILALKLAIWLGYRVASFGLAHFESRTIADLKESAFNYLMGHSYNFFANNFGGALVQRLNRLGRSFERFSDRIYWDLWALIIRVIGITIILWHYRPLLSIIVLVWTIIFIVIDFSVSAWKLKFDIKRAEKDSESTAVLADAISNYNTIQLFSGFSFESKRFKKVMEEWQKITNFTWNIGSVIDSIQGLLFIGVEFILFYVGIGLWQKGQMTIGTFVLVQAYLIQLIDILWGFGRILRDLYESFADASEMVEIIDTPYEIKDIPKAKKLTVRGGAVDFTNVEFSFNQTRRILRGINLKVLAGEKIALIGPSGAGKSTIVKLLLRLYNLESGAITIDGQDISKVTQDSLRDNIAMVPQDPILFHRTLIENIRYGRRDATNEDAYRVATLSHCDDFINDLPLKFDTYVGERGIKLSGGERQRVAIARAMLKDAPIIVLDEATSSLDSSSELLIQDAFNRLTEGKTVIVIAHRLSTIKKVDRIIVIDDGNIAEEGSHNELVEKKNGLYRRLWEVQAGGFIA
ncbi:MAG: ABC transporter ATP-binding protein [bacterium]